MSRAGRLLFVLGILIATVSGLVVFSMLATKESQPEETPTSKVVIAFQNIGARSEITGEQVGMADWPSTMPTPVGSLTKPADAVGKLALVPIFQGQPVLAQTVIDKRDLKESHSSAALILEKGTVAIAMPIDIKSSVAQAIQPGDHVDMLFTLAPSTGSSSASNPVSQRLLANVLILQVGPWPSSDAKDKAASTPVIVTFQMKEQDALVLHHTMQMGAINLVLRPADDQDLVTLEPVTLEYVIQRFGFKPPR